MTRSRLLLQALAALAAACGPARQAEPAAPDEVVVAPVPEPAPGATASPPPPSRSETPPVNGRIACIEGTEGDVAESRERFIGAMRSFQHGDYVAAVEAFRTAYERSCKAPILYNIAVCYERMGEPRVAADVYEQYAAQSPESPNKEALYEKIRELRKRAR